MRNACTLAHHNLASLVHNHHQSRMYLVYCMMYDTPYAHRSRLDLLHKTRCYMHNRSRSRRTWVSSRLYDSCILYHVLDEIASPYDAQISSRFITIIYKISSRFCVGSVTFSRACDLTNCASYDTLAKLTRPGGVYEVLESIKRGFMIRILIIINSYCE